MQDWDTIQPVRTWVSSNNGGAKIKPKMLRPCISEGGGRCVVYNTVAGLNGLSVIVILSLYI